MVTIYTFLKTFLHISEKIQSPTPPEGSFNEVEIKKTDEKVNKINTDKYIKNKGF